MNMYTRLLSYLMIIIGFTGCARFDSEIRDFDTGSRSCSDEKPMLEALSKKRFNLEPTSPKLNLVELTDTEIKTMLPNGIAPDAQGVCKIVGEGFVPGKRYRLVQVRLDNKVIDLDWVTVDDSGQLFSERDNRNLDKSPFDFANYLNGEEARYVLVSDEDQEYIAAITVPNPIEIKWKDGAKVSVVAAVPSMQIFFVIGTGFVPGEKMSVFSSDGLETQQYKVTIGDNGKWSEIPMLVFEGSRTAKLRIKRESDKKEQVVDYAYGIQENIRRMLKTTK